MSGYNDLPSTPSGGCVRDYWLVCGGSEGSRAKQFPDRPQEQPGTVQPHTRSQWFNNVTFSAKTMEKNPHMIGAKSRFVTPSFPWSAPFFHLTCTIDIMVPASRFPNQKTIFFFFFFKCPTLRNTLFCPPSMAKSPWLKEPVNWRGTCGFSAELRPADQPGIWLRVWNHLMPETLLTMGLFGHRRFNLTTLPENITHPLACESRAGSERSIWEHFCKSEV